MKNFILLFALFITLYVSAQEHFPYKRPELLVGKKITIVPIGQNAIAQSYKRFYTEKNLSKYYNGNPDIPKTAMESRKLSVLAVEPNRTEKDFEDYWVTLKDLATGETLYYLYSKETKSRREYYFDVDGGLMLPPDFYCDYIEEMKMPDGTFKYTLNRLVFELVRSGTNSKPYYTLAFQFFKDSSLKMGPLTIVMEDGSKLVLKGTGAYVVSGRSYVGGEITAKELDALTKSKPVSFEYDGKSQMLMNGEILQKGSACLLAKN